MSTRGTGRAVVGLQVVRSSRSASFLSLSFPLPRGFLCPVFLLPSSPADPLPPALAPACRPPSHWPVSPQKLGRYRGPRGCRGRRPRAPAPPPRSSRAGPARARTPASAEKGQAVRGPQGGGWEPPRLRREGVRKGRRRPAHGWGAGRRGAPRTAVRPWGPLRRCRFRVIRSAPGNIIRHKPGSQAKDGPGRPHPLSRHLPPPRAESQT